ncbi:Sperm flagellar protein 2 [Nowakowskiella sp. JEL0407]|nr:Sperm flagellar protein 2 [Nowakowskiella sp. JEL0407]
MVDPESELPPTYLKTMETEEQIFKSRIERIKQHAYDHLRLLRNKGIEAYLLLEEWIGIRFTNEMESIREMQMVIKEAIECEMRLPNELVLDGERFAVDFEVLTFEPDPEPRPESPVEKQMPEQFTVLQLLNLCLQFNEIAPSGNICIKDFVDSLMRLQSLSTGMEILPENFMNADFAQFQQMCTAMDPYETGYLNWRRFIMLQARILPVPSIEQLLSIKSMIEGCLSYKNGKISFDDYMRITLWLEDDEEIAVFEDPAKFNRAAKLKSALFYCFAVKEECQIESEQPQVQEEKRDVIAQVTDTQPEKQPDANLAPPGDTLTPLQEEHNNGVEITEETKPIESTVQPKINELGARFLTEHEKPSEIGKVFDSKAFLMACCLDDNNKSGLQKAFLMSSERDDGGLTFIELQKMIHHFVMVVENSNRLENEGVINDPFPMDLLERIYEELGLSIHDGIITFDMLQRAESATASIIQSPIFVLEELPQFTAKSRPASSSRSMGI